MYTPATSTEKSAIPAQSSTERSTGYISLSGARASARAEGLLQSFREFKPKHVKREHWNRLKDDASALEELLQRLMKRRAEQIQERFLNSGLAFAAEDDLEAEIRALDLDDDELDEMIANITDDATNAVSSVQNIDPADMPVGDITRNTTETVRDLVVSLDNRQKEQAINEIKGGIDEGLGREQIAERVSAQTQASLWRSRMIAQTEVIRAYNTATMASFEQLGVEYVEWGDGQAGACPSCASLDGSVVKRGSEFSDSVRGFARQTPPLHPNCRCTLLRTEIEEEPTRGLEVEGLDKIEDENIRHRLDAAAKQLGQDLPEMKDVLPGGIQVVDDLDNAIAQFQSPGKRSGVAPSARIVIGNKLTPAKLRLWEKRTQPKVDEETGEIDAPAHFHDGWARDPLRAMVSHEVGHAVQEWLYDNADDALFAFEKSLDYKNLRAYGSTNIQEGFAESFSEIYTLPKNDWSPQAAAVNDFIQGRKKAGALPKGMREKSHIDRVVCSLEDARLLWLGQT